MNEAFHERLKRLREAQGWSQSKLADESRLNKSLITTLESDPHYIPSWIVIGRLANALATNPYYLASGDGNDKPSRVFTHAYTWGSASLKHSAG